MARCYCRGLLACATYAVLARCEFANASLSSVQENASTVTLSFGKVHGVVGEWHREFLGIPYAAPVERFAAPVAWTAPFPADGLEALKFTPQCMQADCPNCSEDCLHLNIFTPRFTEDELFPVMLWIHGGALLEGSAMDPAFNGSKLASKQRVVVVTINYRLNIFGFSVIQSADGSVLANNGWRDQREAMRWVRANVLAFGGNPAQITLFGESAGGQSISAHVLSPGSAHLFDAVISESGDFTLVDNCKDGKLAFDGLVTAFGCLLAKDKVACMRGINASLLTVAYGATGAVPACVDGDILLDTPINLWQQGKFNTVPTILGSNGQEGNLQVYIGTRSATARDVECALKAGFGDKTARDLLEIYTPVDVAGIDNRPVLAQVVTDLGYACTNRAFAKSLASKGVPVWTYVFSRHPTCPSIPIPGAYHSSEIMYVFDLVEEYAQSVACGTASAEDIVLGSQMAALFANFSKRLQAVSGWTPFTADVESTLQIDIGSLSSLDTTIGYRRGYCDVLWPLVQAAPSVPRLFEVFDALQSCQRANEALLV